MKFHNNTKEGLFWFIDDIRSERDFSEIRNYILALKDHSDYRSYSDNVVKSIQPLVPEVNDDIDDKYSSIRSNLGIVAANYYGRDSYLKRIKNNYAEEITTNSLDDESLKQQVITFTHHLLFGRESSGIDAVGDLKIEQEGLIPMMNRIMSEVEGDTAQKNELMKHFYVYQLLSEKSSKDAVEAAKHDPNLMQLSVALTTLANRDETKSSAATYSAEEQDTKEDNSKELETRGVSFVDKYASNKKTGGKKNVSFPDL